MLSAAPRPRPPQPIKPTLIVSLPAAWALFSRPRPTAAAVELRKKTRREGSDAFEGDGSVMVRSPGFRSSPGSALDPGLASACPSRPIDPATRINECLYP